MNRAVLLLALFCASFCAQAQFIGGLPKSEQRVVAVSGGGIQASMDLKGFTADPSITDETTFGSIIGRFTCDDRTETLAGPMRLTVAVADLPKGVSELSGWNAYAAPHLKQHASKDYKASRLEGAGGRVICSMFVFKEIRQDWCAQHCYFFIVHEGKVVTLHFISEARTVSDLSAAYKITSQDLEVAQTLSVSTQDR